MNNLKRYTIWFLVIIIFASYSIFLKSANDLVKDYQLSMVEVDNYFVRKAQASELPQIKELEEELPTYTVTVEDTTPSVVEPSSVEDKIRAVFGKDGDIAVALFKAESGLAPWAESTTDRMADGRPFSVGLCQTNLTWHKIDGLDCPNAFDGKDYDAVVVDEKLYKKCVERAKDEDVSLEVSEGIYTRSGDNFGQWGGFTNGSYLKHLK